MPLVLTIHLYVGFLVVLAAVGLIWRYTYRRITLYLVTLQILLGALVIGSGLRPPPVHWLLAVGAWVLYMVANGIAKRKPESRVPLIVAGIASLFILVTFGIGQSALHPHH